MQDLYHRFSQWTADIYFDAVCVVPVRSPDVHSVTVVLPFGQGCTQYH